MTTCQSYVEMFEFWKVLAGVAIFILGMNFLEAAVRQLSGRKFKLFLKKQTAHPAAAIGGGAVATGILQSSSVVNLMVLALVGAGTIPMRNALAIILGANVGTTLSTWVIAAIGFELNIEALAFPIIAVAGIFRIMFKARAGVYNWAGFLLGLGFLFMGLEMMKTGMVKGIGAFDVGGLAEYPAYLYVLAGLVITSLVQSSSATIAIVLSALYAQSIGLYEAAALVLGSEVGTTLKLLVVSVGRQATMKKVALGNFLFNMISSLVIFIFLVPVIRLITDIAGIHNPFLALAFFQTFINLLGIVLFYPLLNSMGKFLDRQFGDGRDGAKFIRQVPPSDTDLAIIAMTQETQVFLRDVLRYAGEVFSHDHLKSYEQGVPQSLLQQDLEGKYDLIKRTHGELYAYYIGVQRGLTNEEQARALYQLVSAARNGMYAAKSMKDARPDIEQLKNSSNDTKYRFYRDSRARAGVLFGRLVMFMDKANGTSGFEDLVSVYQLVQSNYTETLNGIYKDDHSTNLSDSEISTLINFNREMYSGFKSLVFGIKDLMLSDKDAKYFDDLPGFIR